MWKKILKKKKVQTQCALCRNRGRYEDPTPAERLPDREDSKCRRGAFPAPQPQILSLSGSWWVGGSYKCENDPEDKQRAP